MPDTTDRHIIQLLQQNSRRKIREIAELVHLTPPAVSARIQRLEEQGIIRRYTVDIDRDKTGCACHAVITITLKAGQKQAYLTYIKHFLNQIGFHYRISGLGCYLLEIFFDHKTALGTFLDGLDNFASYQLSSVVDSLEG